MTTRRVVRSLLVVVAITALATTAGGTASAAAPSAGAGRVGQDAGLDRADTGLPIAIFLIRVHDRFLPTGLADITDDTSTGAFRAATPRYQQAFDTLAERCGLAA